MKSILAHDAGGDAPASVAAPRPTVSNQPGMPEYLTETEEETFEQMLEQDRRAMAKEDAQRVQQLWGSDE